MKLNDIYWIAGLLEGEGTFTYECSPRLKLNMIDRDIVEKVRSLMKPDGHIGIYQDKRGYKQQYHFVINGSLAIQWMMTLYPLLGERRKEQIRNVIELWNGAPKEANKSMIIRTAIKALMHSKNISYKEAKAIFDKVN